MGGSVSEALSGAVGGAVSWPALAQARRSQVPRLPFRVLDGGRPRLAGSVAQAHLPALAALAALPGCAQALHIDAGHAVSLTVPAAERDAFFATANAWLHEQGLIVGWRHETYAVLALPADGTAPDPVHDLLASFERAAARFWGTATFGAHCNGYVAGPGPGGDSRPQRLWIARRSHTKPTDPGLLDNLVGGGVPQGQTPADTVVREGWEEAGLTPAQMAGLRPGRVLRVARDLPEGWQLEWLSVYDLALPAGLQPVNQDGEVQALHCWPVDQALQRAAAGEMTVDASLATLDFALRHGLMPAEQAALLAPQLQALDCGPAHC